MADGSRLAQDEPAIGEGAPIPLPPPPGVDDDAPADVRGRRFLFATMPSGPFARRLATAIRAAGGEVERLVLNGGDQIDWGFAGSVRPPGRGDDRDWLAEHLRRSGATDVVTLGDIIPYSIAALAEARAAGLRRHVLELGYLRPNWVTLERDGVNGFSALPRDAGFYRALELRPAGPRGKNIAPIARPQAWNTVRHYGAIVALGPFFPRYAYPYAAGVTAQGIGHVRRRLRLLAAGRRKGRWLEALAEPRAPFFLALLQREGDSQLVVHSDLRSNEAFLRRTMTSFRAFAEPEVRLVVKNHPLDPGLVDLQRLTLDLAREHGLEGRVLFVDGLAPLATLAAAARGAVSVNSTAALTAVELGVPTRLLGRAFFDVEGLVDRQPLDGFWRTPAAPDAELFARFRQHVLDTTQVYGSFHNPQQMTGTARRVLRRMAEQSAG